METEALIQKLMYLGLNEREAKLYYSMLRVSEATASDLHRISGVPRTKVYEALERLVSAGFCTERVEGRSRHFRAVAPEVIHEQLMRQWERETRDRIATASSVFEELDKISEQKYNSEKSLDFVGVFRSRIQISRKYVNLVKGARQEILSFVRPPYASVDPANAAEQDKAEKSSLERGVVHRSIYMVDDDWWDDFMRPSEESLHSLGEESRFIDTLPIKMFVFDAEKTLIALPSIPGATGTDFTMIVIEDPAFAETCRILFETFWARALPRNTWIETHRNDKRLQPE